MPFAKGSIPTPYYVIDVLIEDGGPWRTHYSDVVGGYAPGLET
jgi:hypothetical protein